VAEMMDVLKLEIEGTVNDCMIINRREKLLNIKESKFSTIEAMQIEIKPFI
jgi:hypothetical protein